MVLCSEGCETKRNGNDADVKDAAGNDVKWQRYQ